MNRVIAVAIAALTAIGLSACSPAGDDTTLAIASSSGSKAGLTPLGNADREMKTQRPEPAAQLVTTNIRVGTHGSFDRVVFDLEGSGEPGWFVNYTDKAVQQGSGRTIDVEGAHILEVNLDGMVYPFELNIPDPNISKIEGTGNITEVVSGGTFEGRSQFFIGLDKATDYSVQVLPEPTRVVFDINQH